MQRVWTPVSGATRGGTLAELTTGDWRDRENQTVDQVHESVGDAGRRQLMPCVY